MTRRSFTPTQIAEAQLDTALRLYFEGIDYVSVITLAGAAEEILGRALRAKGETPTLDDLVTAIQDVGAVFHSEKITDKQAVGLANFARNIAKHADEGRLTHILFDSKDEAGDMLDRAVDNYWKLQKQLTPSMRRFQKDRHNV